MTVGSGKLPGGAFFFLGHHKIGLYLVVISMHFRGFLDGYFLGLAKFQIFFGGA